MKKKKSHKIFKLAVLIPCHNEAATLGKVIKSFQKAAPDADIYVCNNNSNDNSEAIAISANVNVLNELKKGKANAMQCLFRNVDADYYIMVDADLTYEAEVAMTAFETCWSNNLDMVICVRKSVAGHKTFLPFRGFGNKLFTMALKYIFNSHITDTLSGYRVLSKRFVKSMPIMSKGFGIETEMNIHALSLGLPLGELDTKYFERPSGSFSKLHTIKDGFAILSTIIRMLFDYKPLLILVSLSCFSSILGILLFLPVLADYLNTGLVARLPTAILSLGLIILSVIMFFSGLILDGTTRQRIEIKKMMFLQGDKH